MKKIHFLGECMVELKAKDETTMQQSFAGDVYNSAVYLKRCFPGISTSVVTTIGQDALSDKMHKQFEHEGLDTQFVFRHHTKTLGLYLIETDASGERSFVYWRNDSAAKDVVSFMTDDIVNQLANSDVFFFSGIQLAVISEEARTRLWDILVRLKRAGVFIVFDPNYRARLWLDEQEAKTSIEQALQFADAALPGIEDFAALYQFSTAQNVIDFCLRFDVQEIVVKNGPHSVVTFESGSQRHHTITPVKNVVDTTSAGDAFNGVYIGARLIGASVAEAVALGAAAAGTVIQFPGAIAPTNEFNRAMKPLLS